MADVLPPYPDLWLDQVFSVQAGMKGGGQFIVICCRGTGRRLVWP